jgi:hypothetical protein
MIPDRIHTLSETDALKRRQAKMARILTDLKYAAASCFVIRDKQGRMIPFVFNKAQQYAHDKLEEQKRLTGKVRAIFLKGRQQGLSTYVAARFYHATRFIAGTSTFILSHLASTTGSLFDMVKRFNDKLPEPLKIPLSAANKNQLKFAERDSEYTVATAGNEEVGVGFTIKKLHCSEIAKYEKTDGLETGLFQAVSDMDDTEIILESTANGMGNLFYRKCMDAIAGLGEYILVFIPWFWQEEYRKAVPEGFFATSEELELMQIYNLDEEQIYWRRLKIHDLGGVEKGGDWKFKQEYPMNPMEAFIVSGNPFFSPSKIMAARKRRIEISESDPRILGVDCGRTNDRGVMTLRQGRKIVKYKVYDNTKFKNDPDVDITGYYVDIIARMIRDEGLDKVFIDMGAGYGIVDGLRKLGHSKIVEGVYFGSGAIQDKIFANRRVEMHCEARDWLTDGPVQIPDDDDFMTDLLVIPLETDTIGGKKLLPKKSDIKKVYGRSPDITDSFVLTFARAVVRDTMRSVTRVQNQKAREAEKRPSPFKTENRIRQSGSGSSNTIRVMVDH